MFLAHRNDIQEGEATPLEQTENKKFILKNVLGEYKLGNNICPHQLSRIICKKQKELRCQYHGWSWNYDGEYLHSGSAAQQNNSTLFLEPVIDNNGLLFDQKIDLSTIPYASFENLVLEHHRVDIVDADPRITMDIFLDVDHIPHVHEGVYNLLGIQGPANVAWDYFDWGNIQKVSDNEGKMIATWIAVYPYTMIEWQDDSVFITECFGENKIAVWKYYNKDTSYKSYEQNSQMWETAWNQDKGQALQMTKFSNSAFLEEAKKHYRYWLQQRK
jgi:phenylpropionate dioxygenase-like ring-hydroxylating dioxygenase large terminal subunit